MVNDEYAEPTRLSDPDAEVALLAACLHSKNARIEARRHITGADFFQPAHEQVWDLLGDLDRHGRSVDPVTLMAGVDRSTPQGRALADVVVAVTSSIGHPDHTADYAAVIRGWATRRRVQDVGRQLVQRSLDLATPPSTLAAKGVQVLTAVRDQGAAADVTAKTLAELMEVPDDEPTWVIPGLMETGDRLMLTGTEGAGKSALSRQLGIMAAAGIHPFTEGIMPPIRVAYVDCENKDAQIKRNTRPLLRWLHERGASNPTERVMIDTCGRIDITRDRDLSAIHRLLDAQQPDLLVIGPMYRMTPRALQTDDDAAPFLVALDSIMDRGVALIIEAHAGHGTEGGGGRGARALRPRGSSSLLGWPEFGLGLRALPHGLADLEPWRGGREHRPWPNRMRRAAGNRWVEARPDERGMDGPPPAPWPPEEPPEPTLV